MSGGGKEEGEGRRDVLNQICIDYSREGLKFHKITNDY